MVEHRSTESGSRFSIFHGGLRIFAVSFVRDEKRTFKYILFFVFQSPGVEYSSPMRRGGH